MKKNARGRVRARLTYSNIIATLALFIALGGVSYAAATLPKNSVTTKSIKKSAVTSPKIKNKTITGADVKSNTLTGKQINEATLTVPSAASATFAATAGSAADTFHFFKSVRSSNTGADEASARAAATPIQIASNGSVSVYAKCYRETTTNETHFEVIVSTSANGALLNGYSISDTLSSPGNLLDTTTAEDLRQVTDDETDGPNSFDDDYGDDASVIGPDGKGLYFSAFNYARNGNVSPAPGILPDADSCAFQVTGSKVG